MHSADGPREWAQAIGAAIAVTAALTVLLLAFVWPAVSSAPKDLPVAVAPAAAAPAVQARLASGPAAGVVAVLPVSDENAARQAIAEQRAVGAVVIGPSGAKVLKATLASPVGAGVLDRLAVMLTAPPGQPLPAGAVDVAPPTSGDPQGAGLAVALVPFTIAGLIAAAVLTLRLPRPAPRLVSLLLACIGVGLAFAGMLHGFGVLAGSYWAAAGVIALVVASVAAVTAGLIALFRLAGLAIAAIVMVVIGMPLAGIATGPHVLPAFWAGVGQLLPAGAGGTLLRRAAFFPQAPAGPAVWVLLGWSALGLVLLLASRWATGAESRSRAIAAETVA